MTSGPSRSPGPVSDGHMVSLPRLKSTIPLICRGEYTSHFGASLWMTNSIGAIVLRGTVYKNRRFYCVSLSDAHTGHKLVSVSPDTSATTVVPPTALYASRTPDVKAWHRRLGHCSFDTIVDMARKHSVEGMSINLSSSPLCCEGLCPAARH